MSIGKFVENIERVLETIAESLDNANTNRAPYERFNNCGENRNEAKNRIESFSIKNAL